MITEDILTKLAKPIIVVGNSTLTKKYGDIIDLFPTIIRINNYVIEDYKDLVGKRTSFRCTSGCTDIEARNSVLEFSPFIKDCPESFDVDNYNLRTNKELILANKDIHELTYLERPSTGFSLLLLMSFLGLKITIVGFDGFFTPNLGQEVIVSTHSVREIGLIKQNKNIIILD